ncbi:MAG TPA: glycosyltransferase [Sedimentisphaerales bacterium]|nr:glycosyltransferase [Sedimentisphaerales bacterium]
MSVRVLRVLVYPSQMEIGGSQWNAIEVAEALNARGLHKVDLFAPEGELVKEALDRGLRVARAGRRGFAPSWKRIRRLRRLVRDNDYDIVHSYEWDTTLDVYFGSFLPNGVPMVSTILDMQVPHVVPPDIPLIVGTRELFDEKKSEGRIVSLMEPPVDLVRNSPFDDPHLAAHREECGAGDKDILLVVVGRVADFKVPGLCEAVDAIAAIGDPSIKLAIIGGGSGIDEVRAVIDAAHARTGWQFARLLGERRDPRPYYNAADACIGMGGSALKSMAFAKPLIVQGENGFWALVTDETAPLFLQQGWYGVGTGDGVVACQAAVQSVANAPAADHASWGAQGHALVHERYGLDNAARIVADAYSLALSRRLPLSRRMTDAWIATVRVARFHVARRLSRRRRS